VTAAQDLLPPRLNFSRGIIHMKTMLKPQAVRTLLLKDRSVLAAGSGLTRVLNWFYVAGDDELFLGAFEVAGKRPGTRVRLFAGRLPRGYQLRKKVKLDLESIVHLPGQGRPGHLLVVPSGSRPNRVKGALVALARNGKPGRRSPVIPIDFSQLFAALSEEIAWLNIEGTALMDGSLYLFQRGNGKGAHNSVIRLNARGLVDELVTTCRLTAGRIESITPYDLGTLRNVRLTFTDAAALGGNLWFLAAAEKTESTYTDGESLGTVYGVITAGGQLRVLGQIDCPHKAEGIFAEREKRQVRLYFVTDADDRQVASVLLTALVDRP
jgi:hypothetical protein